VRRDVVDELLRGGALEQQRRGADPQREHDQPAEAERERQPNVNASGGVPVKQVRGGRPQHVGGERVGDGEHVPVEVHGGVRTSGRARGQPELRDVVGRGGDRGEVAGLRGPHRQRCVVAVGHDPQPGDVGGAQIVGEPVVAQGEIDLREPRDRGQLAGAQ